MSGRLVLARHGESRLDAEQRYSGKSDPPLTPKGEEEAQALASSLALRGGMVFDHAVSSPLRAAAQTMRIVIGRIGCHHTIEASLGLRRLHDLLLVQPANLGPGARRRHGARLGERGGLSPVLSPRRLARLGRRRRHQPVERVVRCRRKGSAP